ncbi:MAG: hypothetical protein IKV94_01505 [Clostridia bacterium]|nr:hypothetical protein [Clostridia bacterium]
MRKLNTFKNLMTAIFSNIILALLGFLRIKAFVANLGEEVYSANQLFYQIFGYLSIAEAGVGTLIIQKYYLLLIKKDTDNINVAHTTAKSFLRKISAAIFAVGIVISFFLKHLTNNSLTLGYLQTIFLLFLIRNIIDYLMYTPRLLIQADQKLYKINNIVNGAKIIEILVEVILLSFKVPYEYILIPTIIERIIMNLIANHRVYKEYPWLKAVDKKDNSILKNAKYLIGTRVAVIVSNNTDMLIISSFLSPKDVTTYSAYNYITKFAKDAANIVLNALLASFGNLMHANAKHEEKLETFEEMNSLFIVMGAVICTWFGFFISNFVGLWIGFENQFTMMSLIAALVILYQQITKFMFNGMRDVQGWFKQTQYIAYAEGILNIILSIILLKKIGLAGVLIATVITNFLTNFWFFPIYTYKKMFDKKPFRYYAKFFFNLMLSAILFFITYKTLGTLTAGSFLTLIWKALIYLLVISIIILGLNFILFQDFRNFIYKLRELAKQIFNKNREEKKEQ